MSNEESFRQAYWPEPIIFELGRRGRRSYLLPTVEDEIKREVKGISDVLPSELRRKEPPHLPELTEAEVVRHYTVLSQMNFGIDNVPYPLGSCT
ncbi:MAG TPA: aminomethyl-transferring glycine dehydrogenase subunit GcvPB, partial [Candidatus Bathyarchaeota archaeon]|nr:aminomethyl-transferring glycine dehydrogenase subunit GcvPB [Candidatus Bathyarchaeota archaeon]